MSEVESKKKPETALPESDFSPRYKAAPRFPPLSPEMKFVQTSPTSQTSASTHNVQNYRSASAGRPRPFPLRHTDSDTGSASYAQISPTGHRMLTNPMLVQEVNGGTNAVPVKHILMEARDDGSHANSHFETASGHQSFFQASYAQDQQMDEIIIQKYIAEKNRARAAEGNSAMLQAQIHEMNNHFEAQHAEVEKERSAAFMKFEQQKQVAVSLETQIKDLKEKLRHQEIQTEGKIASIRDEGERKVRMARDESEIKLIGLRNEMMSVQNRLGATKSRLDQETEKNNEITKRFKAMEHIFGDRREQLEREIKKSAQLEKQIKAYEKDRTESVTISRKQAEAELLKVKEIKEKYSDEKQKSRDFSNELKLMSYQYVENLEKLEREEEKTKAMVKELDKVEGKLDKVLKKAAKTNLDLEEMARGFIDTDDLLTREGEISSKLSAAVNAVNVQLHNELAKSKALESEIVTFKKTIVKNEEKMSKLQGFTKSVSDELSTVKTSLASEVSKSAELAKDLKETKVAYEETKVILEETQRTSKSLASESTNLKKTNSTLQSDLSEITGKLEANQEVFKKVSKQLQEQTDAFIKLKAKSMQEKTENSETLEQEERKVKTLSNNLEGVIVKCKQQEETISTLQTQLEEIQGKSTSLAEKLHITEETNLNLENTFQSVKEDLDEQLIDEKDRVSSISKEMKALETKYTGVFNNLVETEESLMETREELKIVKMRLETKDDEFRPVETMLKEEISKRDKIVKEEQDKNIQLTSQTIEINKKCNQMYANLVAAEERILQMEETTNGLKNQITAKAQEYRDLQISLEKERNGPHQRKMKVAKKMIQAEKTRFRALQKEVQAKDLIIQRLEEQSADQADKIKTANEELDIEKEKRSTHSRRVLQEMHQQLEEERKDMKTEKEKLMKKLRSEKAEVKSLSMRLKTLVRSNGNEEASNALKQYHAAQEEVRTLTEENNKLQKSVDDRVKSSTKQQKRLEEVSKSLEDLTNYMDTMVQYCYGLEEEKKFLKKEIESFKNAGNSSSTHNLFNLLESVESDDDDDDDTVSGMSLSDFSVAQIPTSIRRRGRPDIMSRTNILSDSTESLLEPADEEIELTVD
jgi:chromosome segregation ATPase